MLGYLLARNGVKVAVLEKHADFNRDFRGDTVHPSTLQVIYELGMLDEFLKIPHQQLEQVGGVFGDFAFRAASFRHLPTHSKFVALLPQWDLLNFFADKARQFSTFTLRMQNEATGLIEEGGRVTGVRTKTPNGDEEIRSHLVIGCDGRHSTTRGAAHFEVIETGVPIDVLWFRLPRGSDTTEQLLGNFNYGSVLILIPREGYYQAGLLIRKGSFEELKGHGLPAFQEKISRIAPVLVDRVQELKDWNDVSLLSVQINRLRKWHRPGLLCIGDAAHAMSPVGGVGINLAIQDAVATANLLTRTLLQHNIIEADLAQVQARREFPARATQAAQAFAHNQLKKVFDNPGPAKAPWQLKLVFSLPGVQRVMARAVGMGVLPEHVAGTREASNVVTPKRAAVVAVGIAAAAAVFVRCWLRRRTSTPSQLGFSRELI
jgi:2-polyprenyl-6-methoxyphenol hydroxylase-like FAD-dependent oxidoreductase